MRKCRAGMIGAVAVLLASAPAVAQPVEVVANTAAETAAALAEIQDHQVVLLAVSAPVANAADVAYQTADGEWKNLEDCGFGPIEDAVEISPLHDSTHLVVSVRLGVPAAHAANMAACEYAPNVEEPLQMRLTVRGCYLALTYSIPTAQGLVLNPLPSWSCGLTP